MKQPCNLPHEDYYEMLSFWRESFLRIYPKRCFQYFARPTYINEVRLDTVLGLIFAGMLYETVIVLARCTW